MTDLLVGYIDSYEFISVLVDKTIKERNLVFYIIDDENYKRKLETISCFEESDFYKYIVEFDNSIELHREYVIEDNYGHRGKIFNGSIIRHPDFDKKYAYNGPLGFEYHKNYTIFRVWTPVAKEIYVELVTPVKERHKFQYINKGMWECRIEGDLEGYGYLLSCRVLTEFNTFVDPYAISLSANSEYAYVIDIKKTYKMVYPKPEFSGIATDAIIYEAAVRDFTVNLDGELKGTYEGMLVNNPTESGEATGIDYIASLGVSHVQLMPTYTFGGVDDVKKDEYYNWGYNPVNYFTPSGWLSKNPNDPYSRLNELKILVDEIHKRGLRVTMDVVFNHVYHWEDYAFDFLVPGYFYRLNFEGTLNDASGCGNVCATERYMCSRFFRDVLRFCMKEFGVDGFRFDLMGLLDIDTLNRAYEELEQIEPRLIMYGEGWNMGNPLPDEKRPHMYNHRKLPGYAFFNDRYRELLKGNQWSNSAGFSFGKAKPGFEIAHIISGSCLDYFKFDEPTQTVNYVECHDNYTMYDYGKYVLGYSELDLHDACKLALETILVSEGIAFIHAGEEFLRTKKGVENSYNAKDSINAIDYKRRDEYLDVVNSVRALISIRKQYGEFRLSTRKSIERKLHLLEGLCNGHTLAYMLECKNGNLIVIIKNDDEELVFENDAAMIYNGECCNIIDERFVLEHSGVYIFKK